MTYAVDTPSMRVDEKDTQGAHPAITAIWWTRLDHSQFDLIIFADELTIIEFDVVKPEVIFDRLLLDHHGEQEWDRKLRMNG